MSDRLRMYDLLDEIVKNAEARNKGRVLELNKEFREVAKGVYSNPLSELDREYDNCVQSCIVGFTLLPDQLETLVIEAKTRFSRITKPSE